MAFNAGQLNIFFSIGSDEQIDTVRNACGFLKDLSEGATWPEASRDKIEEYVKAFDTVKRYGSADEENKPSEEEVDKAMQVIAGSEQFLSSDAGDGRTVYQCMMDQYKQVLRKRYPKESEERFEGRFKRYSSGAEGALRETFKLLEVNCDLEKAKGLKKEDEIQAGQALEEEPPVQLAEAVYIPKAPAPSVRKTADKWIEDFRKPESLYKIVDGRKTVDFDKVVKIMAARHAAGSVRGSAEKLVTTNIREKDLDKRAADLKKLPHFNDFLESLKDPAKQRKMLSAIGKGHCGGLDDMFTEYLKNLPAGQLENTPELERYMPTAKDRIEALQNQTKQLGRTPADLKKKATAAAEIVQLRNLVQAERKKKSTLDVKIPVCSAKEPADPRENLQAGIGKLIEDEAAYGALCSDDAQGLLREGHGGEMTILLRDKMRASQLTQQKMGPDACRILKHNTYEGRMEELREEAGKIPGLLDKQDEITALDTIDHSKEMLGQYFCYNSDFIGKNGWISDMDEMLHKDIPWGKMNNRFKTVKNFEAYKVFADDMNDIESTKDLMKEMNETGQKGFFNKRLKQYSNYKAQEAADLQKQKELEEYLKKQKHTERKISFDDNEPEMGGGGIEF